jgi:hypothetical protein
MLSFFSQLFFRQMQLSQLSQQQSVSCHPPPSYSMTRVRNFVADLAKTRKSFKEIK